MTQESPARMPPTSTTGRGPNLSISQPSTGTSHVSQSTKIENATCIAAFDQPNFSDIGLTKSVQPYCRLATIAMQMIPMTSCAHRFLSPVFCIGSCGAERLGGEAGVEAAFMLFSLDRVYRAVPSAERETDI